MYIVAKILLVVGITSFIRRVLGWVISRKIMPSQYLTKPDSPEVLKERAQEKHEGLTVKYEFIQSFDGAMIDTIEVANAETDQNSPHIIIFGGNFFSYDIMVKNLKQMATANKWKVISFDYPHVRNSNGTAYSEIALMNAGIAQVDRLLKAGVQDKNIKLYGTSLGGAVATLVADYFHNPENYRKQKSNSPLDLLYYLPIPKKQKLMYLPEPPREPKRVYLLNDRSFSSIPDVCIERYGKHLSRFVIKPLLYFIHWEMNAAAAFRSIPDSYKLLFVAKRDTVIPYEAASLYKKVKPDLKSRFKDALDLYKAYTYSVKVVPNDQLKSIEELHWVPIIMLKDKLDRDVTETAKLFIHEELGDNALVEKSKHLRGKIKSV